LSRDTEPLADSLAEIADGHTVAHPVREIVHEYESLPLPRGKKIALIIACSLSVFIVAVDSTTVNIALPSIREDFGASTTELQWIVSAYTMTLAAFYLLGGSLADRIGRKKVFVAGLTIFALGALASSLAPSATFLIVARMCQAVGGASLAPTAMAIMSDAFTDRVEKARAISIWGSAGGLAGGFGPLLGGVVLQFADWRALYWINIPFVLVCLVLALFAVRDSKAARGRRFDPLGQLLVIATLVGGIFALIEAPRLGWGSLEVIVAGGASLVLGVVLVLYENGRSEPLLDSSLFRKFRYSSAVLAATSTFFVFAAFMFLLTIYLQEVRGLSPLEAGLFTIPSSAISIVGARVGGVLISRFGPRPPLVLAGAGLTISGILMLLVTDDSSFVLIGCAFLFVGIGYSVANTSVSVTALAGAPTDQAGVASATLSVGRQVGQTLGVAICGGTVAAATAATFTQASTLAWWIIVGVGVFTILIGAFQRRR
jgi:EmrB/QacA subfamily drug resistance transporter